MTFIPMQIIKSTLMSRHTFIPGRKTERQKNALDIARRRGELATEWLKSNKLTPETKPEFDKLMKSVK